MMFRGRWLMTWIRSPCGADLTLEVERKFAKYGTVVCQGTYSSPRGERHNAHS